MQTVSSIPCRRMMYRAINVLRKGEIFQYGSELNSGFMPIGLSIYCSHIELIKTGKNIICSFFSSESGYKVKKKTSKYC
jgi:hypothetical protein